MQQVIVTVRRADEAQARDLELPADVEVGQLSQLIAEAMRWSGPAARGATIFDIEALPLGRAIRPGETLASAGVWDGSRLVLRPVATPALQDIVIPRRDSEDMQARRMPAEAAPPQAATIQQPEVAPPPPPKRPVAPLSPPPPPPSSPLPSFAPDRSGSELATPGRADAVPATPPQAPTITGWRSLALDLPVDIPEPVPQPTAQTMPQVVPQVAPLDEPQPAPLPPPQEEKQAARFVWKQLDD